MDDTTFMLVAVVVIIVGLLLFVINANDSFNTWYGDSGFLKVEKTFRMNLFNFSDFINTVFGFLFLWMLIGFSKNTFEVKDARIFTMALFSVLMVGFLPFFYFYKKYLFYKINGNLDYTFDPNDKTLHINDIKNTKFSKSDILTIKTFSIGGRIDFYFKIIYLKSGNEIIISSDLPFCNHLYEFFGENTPFEWIEFSPFDLFKYLKMLRSYI